MNIYIERVEKTILEMIKDRGYTEKLDKYDYPSFGKPLPNSEEISYLFHEDEFGADHHAALISEIEKENISMHVIIIFDIGSGGVGQKVLRENENSLFKPTVRRKLEFLDYRKYIANITRHSLVPEHMLLTAEEKIQMLKIYKIKITQIPKISRNDPVAVYYGFEVGSVIRITRKNGIITFRVVN